MQALKALGRARKSRRRGVSPIIATILLVAITVVLAAVLYVLISGLTHTGGSTPYELGMATPVESTQSATEYFAVISISPQTGLTTGMFGLALKSATGSSIAVGSTTAGCVKFVAFTTTNCGTPTIGATGSPTPYWYAVLFWVGNNTIANVFSYAATGSVWTSPTLPVTNAESLVVISATSLAGTADYASVFSIGSASVSGQSGPF